MEMMLVPKGRRENDVENPIIFSLSVAVAVIALSLGPTNLVYAESEKEPMTEQEWTFDQGKNVACITVRDIVENGKPILYVSHDAEDHSWQFLTGGDVSSDEAMVISMAAIVKIDPSLLEVGHIPPGFTATRSSISDDWIVTKTTL